MQAVTRPTIKGNDLSRAIYNNDHDYKIKIMHIIIIIIVPICMNSEFINT